MSDSENERKPDSQEGPSVMTPETLRESLDELAKNVDDLVDRLTMDMTDSPVDEKRSKQSAAPPGAPGTQTPPATTPPSSPVKDEPPSAAALAPDVSAEAPATPPAPVDEDLVPPGSIDEDLEIMGLAGDVVDSVAGAEPEAVEEEAPAAESEEPEATAETIDSSTMSVADQIDAELAKTAELTDDSAAAAEADDFMAMETPVEPPTLEEPAADHEEALPSFEPELPAVEARDAEAATKPPEALDLDVQKEIDAIDAGLDSLFAQDEVGTGAKAKEQETLKLANGPRAESATQGIELAVGPEPTTAPDTTKAAGQTSRLKKPARADVVPWSAPPSPRRHRRGASRTWRLVAAMLFLGAVGGGAWVLLSTEEPPTIDFQLAASGGADRDSGDAMSRTAGTAIPFIPASSGDGAPESDSPPVDEPAVTQPETPPAPEAPAAAPAPKKPAPSPPRAETPKPAAAKTPPPAPAKQPSSKIATKPTPPPARNETKPAKTEPEPAVTSTPPDTPKVADARPVATPVTPPKPASPKKTAETVTTRPEPVAASETPSGTPSAAPVASDVDRDPPAPVEQPKPAPPEPTPRPRPAAGPTSPAEPAADLVPPQLVTRQEPIYPPRARKRGEGGVVELKVLVNEQGRVVRVVVEQGLPGSELEARAIDAALRSTYRPATEAGRPVRAWVTERFVFEP